MSGGKFLGVILCALCALRGYVSSQDAVGAIAEGGPIAPDGKTQVACDIPVELRKKNIGGVDGAGLCVFTSIMHDARYQNERKLWNFQEQMSHERGGGTPQKVDAMIAKYAPGARYLQHTGGDVEFLKAALKTGRPVGVTYAGHDVHYSDTIAHMVSLVYLDDSQACILDNNYIGANQLVWMSAAEFIARWKGDTFFMRSRGRQIPVGGSWAVVLLAPPAPPVPRG